jgi:pyrroline-5-carboxylate reductase
MGEAIIAGLIKAGTARVEDLCVVEPVADRRKQLSQSYPKLAVQADPGGATAASDALLIAIKPQDFDHAADALRASLRPEQLVISIMAGVRIGTLIDKLAHERVVRVMPNTPAALGAGFSAWLPSDEVTSEQRDLTRRVLQSLGREAEFHDERYLDMATAISGSGPAYVFLFLEAYINAAVHIGMPRAQAADMVIQTVLGSVEMAQSSGNHLAALRDSVTSPGGTTVEALHELERGGLRTIMTEAVKAAYEKSRALGG